LTLPAEARLVRQGARRSATSSGMEAAEFKLGSKPCNDAT
jgi:hypothetical protein